MTNAELIDALRYCGGKEKYCELCPSYDICHAKVDGLKQILLAAADLIEELQQIADHHEQTTKDFWNEACEYKQRIAELEAQLPKEGEWIESNRRPRSAQFYCSVCHRTCYDIQPTRNKAWTKRCRYHYCPSCGARMKGEQE